MRIEEILMILRKTKQFFVAPMGYFCHKFVEKYSKENFIEKIFLLVYKYTK